MTTYALIQTLPDGTTQDTGTRRTFDQTPPLLNPAKGLQWLPWVDTPRPEHDPLTHGVRLLGIATDNGRAERVWEVYPLPVEESAALQRAQAKARRDEAVQAITVTTAAGNTFDGDETSQNRMARAIIALRATDTPTVPWTLADNTVINASAAELTEALALAGAAQAALWPLE